MAARQLGQAAETAFTDFAPDVDPTSKGIILDSSNAVPTIKGYRSRNAPVPYAPALPGTPAGAYVALYANGTVSVIAVVETGSSTTFYRLVSGAWTSVGVFGVTTGPWYFAQFADDVIATTVGAQFILVANGASGTFAELDATAPTYATTVISVAGFAAAYQANQWFNSSAGTDTSWTPNVQTQSASGFLYDLPGNIVAAAPFFRTQIVWKQQAMWLLNYIGGTQVWSSQLLSVATGTWSQSCVVLLPEAVAFLGTDDFYMTQGYAPTRIPNNLKEWFFYQSADTTQLANTQSWFDPINSVVYWHYVSLTPPFAGVPDQYVAWNTRNNRWAHGYLSTPLVINNTQPGLTSGLYFDTNNVLQSWTGAPGTMSLLTGYQGDGEHMVQLQRVRPKYNTGLYPTGQSFLPMSTYILGKPDTVWPGATLGQDAWFNTRATDRYIRGQLNTVGLAEVAALEAEVRTSGVR
ncbi:MAG: hypothetical protein WBQ34_10115 [Candidatus Acidiferrales bacterium]